MQNQYAVLGVAQDADPEVIKAAWRALCQKYHPDRSDGPPDAANEKMSSINRAYKILSDPELRAQHDRDLSEGDSHRPRKERPAQARTEEVDYTTPHPWRRFFAANIDVAVILPLSVFLISLFIKGDLLGKMVDNPLLYLVMVVFVFVFLDAVITAVTGTTIGKWLFGLSVKKEGEVADEIDCLMKRSLFRMPWLLVPFLALHGYYALVHNGKTTWDRFCKTSVGYKKTSAARDFCAAVAVGVVFLWLSILNMAINNSIAQVRKVGAPVVAANPAQQGTPNNVDWDKGTLTPPAGNANPFNETQDPNYKAHPSENPNSAIQMTPEEKKRDHFRRIYAVYPDANAIFALPEFDLWLQQNPERQNAFNQGQTELVLDAIFAFKLYQKNGRKHPEPRSQKIAGNEDPDLRSAKPRCVFKSVMTDDDYRVCGATPPAAE